MNRDGGDGGLLEIPPQHGPPKPSLWPATYRGAFRLGAIQAGRFKISGNPT